MSKHEYFSPVVEIGIKGGGVYGVYLEECYL